MTEPMDNSTIEEHLATLLDKLEAMREAREATVTLSRRYRPAVRTEVRTLEFWRSIIAECLAAFFFVFLVSAAGAKTDIMAGDTVLTTGLASGLGMAVLVYCFGSISGGHVNPAISLAYAVTKKMTPLRGIMYVLAQCGGAIGGAALLYGVASPNPAPAPTLPLGPWERFGVELVLTFIVAFTQVSVSTSERKIVNNSPLLVGAAYTACSLVPGSILNPARALGPAFVTNKQWESHWVFWLGPVLGASLATVIFEFIFNSKRQKRPKDSIDGDSSSIQSDDERFEDGKYHSTAYRPVAPNPTTPNVNGMYCANEVTGARYSSPPKAERVESIYGGKSNKSTRGEIPEGIYGGTRSLYNAKIETKSPPLTRANLNRSQSVYSKTQNPRDLLPRPGPLVPAQSLYPIKLGGQFSANIRDFATPDGNFITGIKTEDGNYLKIGNGLNAGAQGFLVNRGGSKSYHDIAETDKPGSAHVANQNLQNQLLGGEKENVYGLRGSPAGAGGVYPTAEPRQPAMNRTAAYVKSVQNQTQAQSQKQRENYDVVPSGVREVAIPYNKQHNRSETSDYGSNRSEGSYTHGQRSDKPDGKVQRLEGGPVGCPQPPQMRLIHNKMPEQMSYLTPAPRHSPISSVSSSSYSRNSPNPPYPPPPCQ